MTKVEIEKVATLAGHRDCIYVLEGSDKPENFFSSGGDGMVVKWNLQVPDLGALVAKVPSSVYALCYIEKYHHLVVGQNFEGVHVIDLYNNTEIKSLKTGAAHIFDIKFTDDELYVASGDGTLTIINYPSFEIKKKLKYSDKSVRCIALNEPCKDLAVGYSDNYIRIFDMLDHKVKYEIAAHQNSVFTVVYASDSKSLYSAGRDAKLKKWNVFNGYSLDEEVVAHMYAINHLAFSPDGSNFVTCSMDKSIKVWDTSKTQLLKVIDRARHAGHGTSVNKLLWTSFNHLLISCSDDKMISVWKLKGEGD